MMVKLLLVVFIGFVSSVYARSPRPTKCESNVIGHDPCSEYGYGRKCKPGYTCINNRCCRDPVCPPTWTEGDSCSTLPREVRCQFRFQCIDGFCCKPPTPKVCPSIPEEVPPWCSVWFPGARLCTPTSCPPGTKCCPNDCGWRMCMDLSDLSD